MEAWRRFCVAIGTDRTHSQAAEPKRVFNLLLSVVPAEPCLLD